MRRNGITSVDLVTLLALAAVAALVVLPRLRVSRILLREEQVIADLHDLSQRLEEHRKSAALDEDADGVGEYAPLGDILGSRRDQADDLGGGVWALNGYRFAVLVPGAQRRTPVVAGTGMSTPDYAEVGWMIVAWPLEPGVTGMRAYAMTPHGLLLHQIDGFPYGDAPPFPDDVMVIPDGRRVLRAQRTADERSKWKPPVRTLREGDERPAPKKERAPGK